MINWRDFKSSATEDIPPFSVVELIADYDVQGDDDSNRSLIQVDQASTSGSGIYAITGAKKVASEGYGRLTFDSYVMASYDDQDGDYEPSIGDELGVLSGTWPLSASADVFLYQVAGSPDTARKLVRVMAIPAKFTLFGVTTETITSADWDSTPITLGKGLVKLYRVKVLDPMPDPIQLEEVSADDTVIWYNCVPSTIPKNRIVQAKIISGLPVIDVESCVAVSVIP